MDIRDVRLFTTSKNSDERQNIMNWWVDTNWLVAQYKMDEWSGTIVYDSSWNWQNWTLVNWVQHIELTDGFGSDFQNQVWYTDNAWVLIPRDEINPTQDVQWNPLQYTWRVKYDAELIGRSYSFNWINQFVQINTDLWASVNLTISVWYYHDKIWRGTIASSWPSYNNPRLYLAIDDSRRVWFSRSNNNYSNQSLEQNRRYHICVTSVWWIDTIYIDWVLDKTASTESLRTTQTTFSLWSGFAWATKWNMYDLRVYNKWKSIAEIWEIMSWWVDTDWLVAQYKLDEGGGNTAYDSSWNAYHWSLINWLQQITWKNLWTARQKLWHSQSWLVSIPRNEAIPSQDVLWNTLQYPWDGYYLLPSWQVDFNPWLAPELIRKNAPINYTYWDSLPATMTKTTATDKENNFIVLT